MPLNAEPNQQARAENLATSSMQIVCKPYDYDGGKITHVCIPQKPIFTGEDCPTPKCTFEPASCPTRQTPYPRMDLSKWFPPETPTNCGWIFDKAMRVQQ